LLDKKFKITAHRKMPLPEAATDQINNDNNNESINKVTAKSYGDLETAEIGK